MDDAKLIRVTGQEQAPFYNSMIAAGQRGRRSEHVRDSLIVGDNFN